MVYLAHVMSVCGGWGGHFDRPVSGQEARCKGEVTRGQLLPYDPIRP